MLVKDKLFIGGRWVAPSSRETIDVHNAGNGEVMGRVPAGDEKDAEPRCARRARRSNRWSADAAGKARGIPGKDLRRPQGARRRAGEDHRAGSRHAAQDGEPHPGRAADRQLRQLREAGARIPVRESKVGNSLVVREPVGVVGAITPWNYPLHQIALKVAPALAAGCTVVLKPSEVAPFNAFMLAEVIEQAGLPKGVFNLVTGYRPAGRRGAGEASRRRHDLLHRLDARRQAHLGARRADA